MPFEAFGSSSSSKTVSFDIYSYMAGVNGTFLIAGLPFWVSLTEGPMGWFLSVGYFWDLLSGHH